MASQEETLLDYFLSEEQEMIVETARQITDERIIPQRAELDEKDEFPAGHSG